MYYLLYLVDIILSTSWNNRPYDLYSRIISILYRKKLMEKYSESFVSVLFRADSLLGYNIRTGSSGIIFAFS